MLYEVITTFSLAGGLVQLFSEGQWLLAILIGGFSVVLPLAKLVLLFRFVGMRWSGRGRLHRYLGWMHRYGRWSMLDVFVVAVLVATVKLGVIAAVQIHAGLYLFAGAVLTTMAVTGCVITSYSIHYTKLYDQPLMSTSAAPALYSSNHSPAESNTAKGFCMISLMMISGATDRQSFAPPGVPKSPAP